MVSLRPLALAAALGLLVAAGLLPGASSAGNSGAWTNTNPSQESAIDFRWTDDLALLVFVASITSTPTLKVQIDAFDDLGFPITEDGRSTVVPGLYFCGVHFLRKRKSSIFMGIGEDAAIVARSIAGAAALTTA